MAQEDTLEIDGCVNNDQKNNFSTLSLDFGKLSPHSGLQTPRPSPSVTPTPPSESPDQNENRTTAKHKRRTSIDSTASSISDVELDDIGYGSGSLLDIGCDENFLVSLEDSIQTDFIIDSSKSNDATVQRQTQEPILDLNSLSTTPSTQIQIQSLAIQNSKSILIGNKNNTIYNGPVTIKQEIQVRREDKPFANRNNLLYIGE